MGWIRRSKELLSEWIKQGEMTPELEQKIREFIADVINELPEPSPRRLPEITYGTAISYFVTNRPDNQAIAKGAILRQNHPAGIRIVQVFLDEHNELVCNANGEPYGQQILVDRLDKELEAAFGNANLIIVE